MLQSVATMGYYEAIASCASRPADEAKSWAERERNQAEGRAGALPARGESSAVPGAGIGAITVAAARGARVQHLQNITNAQSLTPSTLLSARLPLMGPLAGDFIFAGCATR